MERRRACSAFAFVILAAPVSVFAQGTFSPSTGGTPPAREIPNLPARMSNDPDAVMTRGNMTSMTLTVAGRVVVEGGIAPPTSVLVEAGCSGAMGGRTYTDKKGRFQLSLGQLTGMAESTIDGDSTFYCTFQAALAGYHTARAGAASTQDHPLLTLHPLQANQGTIVSATDLQAPKPARDARDRARAAMQKQDWPAARSELDSALKLYPQYAGAWYDLGVTLEQQKSYAEARDAWNKCVALDRRFLKPYTRLAELAAAGSKWQEMASVTDRALVFDPVEQPVLYLYHAIAYFNLGDMKKAEQSARRAIALDSDGHLPRAEYILGRALAHENDNAGALDHMQRYLKLMPAAPDAAVVRAQISEAEKHKVGGS